MTVKELLLFYYVINIICDEFRNYFIKTWSNKSRKI